MPSDLFNIYVPSYGRAETTNTFKLLEYCTYVVRKSEEKAYRARGIENIWAVPDNQIDNICKTVNYIVDNSPETVICMVDDDLKNFVYRLDTNEKLFDPEIITSELERIGQIMLDLDVGFGAEDAAQAPWNYSAEFTFKGTTGAFRWFNKNAYKSRFREEVLHNCDLDVMLHELLVNRITIKPMYLVCEAGTDKNAGGNSSKNRQEQRDCATEMIRRWGKYFRYNWKNNKPTINVSR